MKNGSKIDAGAMKASGLDVDTATLSRTAYEAMNGEYLGMGSEDYCIERVNGLKEEYGTGASTLVTIYNSTGFNFKLVAKHDIWGGFFKYAPDTDIYNGEWSCVLHAHPGGQAIGSHGMLCYGLVGSKDGYGLDVVLVMAWANHYTGASQSKCEFFERNAYSALVAVKPSLLYDSLLKDAQPAGRSDFLSLGVSYGIGAETSPIFRVVASQVANL